MQHHGIQPHSRHAPRQAPPQSAADPAFQLEQPPVRVLIATEDRAMRRAMATTLKRDGYEVMQASDGSRLLDIIATSMIRSPNEMPDIIISDDEMPRCSGMTVLAGLRKNDWVTPIVLISPPEDEAAHEKAYRLGADAVLDKPVEMNDLRVMVRTLVTVQH
jgi:DNA-binding response OmpR family regulator